MVLTDEEKQRITKDTMDAKLDGFSGAEEDGKDGGANFIHLVNQFRGALGLKIWRLHAQPGGQRADGRSDSENALILER